eukprot:TRINITY_DN968_c0_g1_i2.p1 TRINITY_DN968_c0_g1~~TRINITY_DN968_c0_g1_i2.p1  ORF type:complete len:305 (+),score=104.14 TRINITY_DN968_c0_g1_i2:184-1098(+)
MHVSTPDGKVTLQNYMEGMTSKKYDLSLVVPAYNEEKRVGSMLAETLPFFDKKNLKYEVIIVNDASKDKTSEVVLESFKKHGKRVEYRLVEYPINKGKGGAVRMGMLVARGDYILMLDADGATKIDDFDKCFDKLKSIQQRDTAIITGSRNQIVEEAKAERSFIRKILGFVSNFIITVICGVKLKDTQCGFKIFTQKTAQKIFYPIHLERWAFDVEIFILANHFNIPYAEVPVNWRDVEGSHLNVITASITMARDFVLVRLLYLLGLWKYNDAYVLPLPPTAQNQPEIRYRDVVSTSVFCLFIL